MKKVPASKTEATKIMFIKQQKKELCTEEMLQMDMVMQFSEKNPEKRGRLFATFQNPTPAQYGIWVSRGMVAGVSDLIWIDDLFRIVGIEVKHPEREHHRKTITNQANWLIKNCYRGYFCTSVEMFWNILSGGEGIDPKEVIKFMEKHSTIKFKNLYL